jgi:hypothetical protein
LIYNNNKEAGKTVRNKGLVLFISALMMLMFSVSAQAYKVPDTGQTKCYDVFDPYYEIDCAGTGQDGEYNINPRSFSDHGDGTVTDNNTGLMWQKCGDGQDYLTCDGSITSYNWYRATGTYDKDDNPKTINACGDLSLGSHTDWRLPTIRELRSLVNFDTDLYERIDAVFPNTGSNYWSSTWSAAYPDNTYIWTMASLSGSPSVTGILYYSNYVRCVRGEQQETKSFTNNGNGTVTDNVTGLMWQRCNAGQNNNSTCSGTSSELYSEEALAYCNNLDLGNYSDWRLPNVNELASLVDYARYNPAIDATYFPPDKDYSSATYKYGHYWSSTIREFSSGVGDYAWYQGFVSGIHDYQFKRSNNYVRCVRGGEQYCANKKVKIGSATAAYNTIQSAYNAAASPATIRSREVTIAENLAFKSNKVITLIGGYDCDFSEPPGFTTISGSLTIGGTDTLTISGMIIN